MKNTSIFIDLKKTLENKSQEKGYDVKVRSEKSGDCFFDLVIEKNGIIIFAINICNSTEFEEYINKYITLKIPVNEYYLYIEDKILLYKIKPNGEKKKHKGKDCST